MLLTEPLDLEESRTPPDRARATYPLVANEVEPGESRSSITELLTAFAPIALSEMKNVALLDRCEVKYVIDVTSLVQILPALGESYSVLEVEGHRLNRYRTLYFDTVDFALYRRHHMGARNRYKVRAREYVESHLSFFEVKHKTNKRRTIKHRLSTSELVTLDVDLVFRWREQKVELPGIVIAEVKQPSHGAPSAFVQLMREQHIHKGGFSKYCMGISLLYPEIKHNKFKPLQRRIARLIQGNTHVIH